MEDHQIWCSLAESLRYLIITLKSTRARKNWAPAANTRNHNSPDCLPSTTNSESKNYWILNSILRKSWKLQKILNSLLLKFWQLRNLKPSQNSAFSTLETFISLWKRQLFKETRIFQPLEKNSTIAKNLSTINLFSSHGVKRIVSI